MTKVRLITLAAVGSLALLSGAFLFQFLGYAPCKMCLWQRWPHGVAVVIGVAAILVSRHKTIFALLGALATATTAAIGLYHTGVERGWWEGPTSCSGNGAINTDDLLNLDITPVVMCDDVVWSLMGLSMASYNALLSLVLVAIWIAAARR